MEPSQDETSTDDEELDIKSDKFNPLKALYSDKFKVPFEGAQALDNVGMFMSRLKKAGNAFDADLEPRKAVKKSDPMTGEEEDDAKYHVTAAGRKFLKEQAPIHRGPKAKFSRDIFKKMESAKGPISLLNKFKVNRTRVKIYIRKEHGIRGSITGFIEAFDKHFNIALVDCSEVWKRRKFKFSDNNVALLGPPQDCSTLLKSMGIKVPAIATKSLDRKTVQCSRQLAQVMVRGEDVVLIAEDKDAND